MHILWVSDSPDTPSGFGTVTRVVCAGLAAKGHTVDILGWQSTRLGRYRGCTVRPVGRSTFGSEALYAYLSERRPDVIVVLGDIWWLPSIMPPWVRRHLLASGTPVVLHFPVDGTRRDGRLPPSWTNILEYVDVGVAMSRYGQEVARKSGIAARYIPHGVNTRLFRPPRDRDEAKRRAGVAGRFVVLSDSRNQPRKMLPRLLDIFALFASGHPEAVLHLHTDPDDARQPHYSYDLRADIRSRGLAGRVRFSEGFQMRRGRGLPLTKLAALYRAADVHLLASAGEGFGLPTLQASAAGVVPLAGAHSACSELLEGHGQQIAVAAWVEDEFGIRRGLVDIEDGAKKLAGYCDDPEQQRRDASRCRAFARSYEWGTVIDAWDELLKSLPDEPLRPNRLGQRRTAVVAVPGLALPGTTATATLRMLDNAEARLVADRVCGREMGLPANPSRTPLRPEPLPRRRGLVAASDPRGPEVRALRAIFPLLRAWAPPSVPTRPGEDRWLWRLGRSALLMHLTGDMPDEILVAAAVLGVPCLGLRRSALQTALWPDLSLRRRCEAVDRARALLTDSSMMDAVTAAAARTCTRIFALPTWRPLVAFHDDTTDQPCERSHE